MRHMLFPMLLLMSAVAWAGGEVPWPKENQEDIRLRTVGGLWVSQHLDAPQRQFYFNLERGGITEACPFVLRVFEVEPGSGELITAGGSVFCKDRIDEMNIVLYDFSGNARNTMHVVAIKKPLPSTYAGYQMLGITLSTYESTPEVIAQDAFYMFAQ